MKKLTTLMLAAGLVFAASAPASAVDVKFDGQYLYQFTQGSKDWQDGKYDANMQMVRIGMTFAASENLSGYAQLHGKWNWGNVTNEAGQGNLGVHPEIDLRQAYIDWIVPATPVKVRMGRQLLALPHTAFGKNSALWWSDPADGIAISAPVTDWLGLSAWWARYQDNGQSLSYQNESVDVFAAIADIKLDGIRIQPYFAFAAQGENTLTNPCNGQNRNDIPTTKNNTYWLGASSTVSMFDPFTFKASFIYGDRNFNGPADEPAQHGWVAEAVAEYKTAYGVPSLGVFYGSGSDDDAANKWAENMPSLFGRFRGSYGFFNGSGLEDNGIANGHTPNGVWGVRAGMSKISFVEGLSHDIAVMYAQGTNDKKWSDAAPHKYMTEEDSVVEFDFSTTYKIYKNLTAYLECAYVLEDFDTKLDNRKSTYDDAWTVALQFTYNF